jgi:hypothetical protein
MRILFVDSKQANVGSSRVWVHDLSGYLRALGHETRIAAEPVGGDYHAVLLGKGALTPERSRRGKELNPGAVVGWINPPASASLPTDRVREPVSWADFFIAGSIEERDSLLPLCPNVFIFPLVERRYTRWKRHRDRTPVVLGYHGNAAHLTEFSPHLTRALELLDGEMDIRLRVVYSRPRGWEWRTGRPRVRIDEVPWDLSTIEEELLRCDIGLVPGMTPVSEEARRRVVAHDDEGYETDYVLRFKNKSNAGRCFVFHQLGIPVVAAFMPSNFHVLGNPDCGALAHSTEGWLHGIRSLACSAALRSRVAAAASLEFHRLYDPLQWARRLVDHIVLLRRQLTNKPAD